MKRFLFSILLTNVVMNSLYAEENKLINQDRIWVYESNISFKDSDDNGEYSCKRRILTKYRFGDVVERYGREYTEWILVDTQDIDAVSYVNDPERVVIIEHAVESKDSVAAYMREEDERVYLLLDDRKHYIYDSDNDSNVKYYPSEGEETMLYDFSVEVGDTFNSIYSGCILTGMNAVKVDNVIVGDRDAYKITAVTDATRRTYDTSDTSGLEWLLMMNEPRLDLLGYAYIEGVGSINYGGMTQWIHRLTKLINSNVDIPILTKVYDYEGKELYSKADAPSQSNIDEIDFYPAQTIGKSESGVIMDLHGRTVTTPVSGSIYIRNGKKFVFK